jgi:hypothetical protein
MEPLLTDSPSELPAADAEVGRVAGGQRRRQELLVESPTELLAADAAAAGGAHKRQEK